MADIDGAEGLGSSVGPSGEARGKERRERAMAEAALTLAEIGASLSRLEVLVGADAMRRDASYEC